MIVNSFVQKMEINKFSQDFSVCMHHRKLQTLCRPIGWQKKDLIRTELKGMKNVLGPVTILAIPQARTDEYETFIDDSILNTLSVNKA